MTDTEKKQERPLFKQLAEEFTSKGDPAGWFEVLYQTAQGNEEAIPWAYMTRRNPPQAAVVLTQADRRVSRGL